MIKRCDDNTIYNRCSKEKPKYCSDGKLIDKCSLCGCDESKDCKEEMTLDAETLELVKKQLSSIPDTSGEPKVDVAAIKFYHGKGCATCNKTGYKGRVGAYEIIVRDGELEQSILKGILSEYDMRALAQKQGMVTMAQDGLLKAIEGLTTVEEVKRIVGIS